MSQTTSTPIGLLSVVPTPIGNLEDITLRALRVLRTCDVVAAEDTRRSRQLLAHYEIHKPLFAYHAYNVERATPRLLAALREGQRVALVTDAGMPGISDPGAALVRQARATGAAVEVLPGPSAFVVAAVASGLRCDHLLFDGFLPAKDQAARKRLQELAGRNETLIFYEAPHRLAESLARMAAVLGPRPAVLCRELTKVHEEIRPGTLDSLAAQVVQQPVRGECVVVVAGADALPDANAQDVQEGQGLDPQQVAEELSRLTEEGLSRNAALRRLAQRHHTTRNALYTLLLHASEE